MKDKEPIVCVKCHTMREPQRYDRHKSGRRSRICQLCVQASLGPKPCKGCGTLTPLNLFPELGPGRRSTLCVKCHDTREKKKCMGCKKSKPRARFHLYPSGQRSRTCDKCRKIHHAPKTCCLCKKLLPYASFHRYRGGTMSVSCNACRTPYKNTGTSLQSGPNPCVVCGGAIVRDAPPSKLNRLKTCSEQCRLRSVRRDEITCLRCKRILPYDKFGKYTQTRGRTKSCLECLAEDTERVGSEFRLRPSIWQLRMKMELQAKKMRVPFSITSRQARQVHKAACELCGKAVSAVSLREPALGYVMENCRPVCRTCDLLLRRVGWAELVLLSNEIAARHKLHD